MASAAVTRLLVLGVVSLFQPVNGYQVMRELKSWYVEDWAQVKPGSIYSMLNSLAKQEKLVRHELTEQDRAIAVYEVSETGAAELPTLVQEALDGSTDLSQVMFQAAMSFAPMLTRAEVIEALRRRLDNVARHRDGVMTKIASPELPAHVRHVMSLDFALIESELAWLTEFVSLVENGMLWFAGESGNPWEPPPDDAGWEMVEQAERYREELRKRRRR